MKFIYVVLCIVLLAACGGSGTKPPDVPEAVPEATAVAPPPTATEAPPAPAAGLPPGTSPSPGPIITDLVHGRGFLVNGLSEDDGYALYSYILMASKPTDDDKARVLAIIQAYLDTLQPAKSLESNGASRHAINIMYIPVIEFPNEARDDQSPSAEWLLEHYDYARATVYLSKLKIKSAGGGPILTSCDVAVGTRNGAVHEAHFDLSNVPPTVVRAWVGEFLNATSKSTVDEVAKPSWTMNLRTTIANVTVAMIKVNAAMKKLKDALSVWKSVTD